MASTYANSLKKGLDPGPCGQPEIHETERAVRAKVATLARWIESSRYIVVHTGAGISTSCGIPDFRGPNGIWTIQKRMKAALANKSADGESDESQSNSSRATSSSSNATSATSQTKSSEEKSQHKAQKRKRENSGPNVNHSSANSEDDDGDLESLKAPKKPKIKEEKDAADAVDLQEGEVTWEDAKPSLTHMALMALTKKGLIEYIVTQNVDGLHVKSGIAPSKLSELHGNVFKEKCDQCWTSVYHDHDLKSLGLNKTGRRCKEPGCSGWMRDAMVDWDQPLPDDELGRAEEHSMDADLSICIGTSLRVSPANELPLYAKRNSGRVVIINLQQTELDKSADLNIRAKCDLVFELLMPLLHTKIPVFGQHHPMKFNLPEKWDPESSDDSSSEEERLVAKKTAKKSARKVATPSTASKVKAKPQKRQTQNSAKRSILPKSKLEK